MRLLAALSGAVFVYLLVGLATGHGPRPMGTALAGRLSRSRRGPQPDPAARLRLLAISAGAGATAFVTVWILSGAWPVGVVPALAVGLAPRGWAGRQSRKLAAERVAAWPDALRDLVAHLQAPMSLHRALVELGRSGPAQLRPAWRRYEQLSAALDSRAALEAVRGVLSDPVSDRVVEVLLLAQRQGESVVLDVLRDLAASIAQDVRLSEEMETAQLERRIEARAAAVLPFAVLVLLTSTSEPYRDFYSSARGLVVILVGGAMVMAGSVAIARLGRQPGEERVLVPIDSGSRG